MAVRALATAAAGVALAVLATGCGTAGLTDEAADTGRGKQLFAEKCASCHALADAGSKATIGPNLDAAFRPGRNEGFEESTVRAIVATQIRYPADPKASPDVPPMPANLVEGDDVAAVAAYVAAVAGTGERIAAPAQSPAPTAGGGKGGGAGTQDDAKSLFNAQGCGGCHVLSDAGATGTVGPNLDESKPTVENAVDQIANGGGGMPPYKGRISDEQIRALAEYVARAAAGS